jgi:hypothetical protein
MEFVLAAAKGGEGVKSGPIGLAVILVLCVAAYFLFKSMSKHLKKVREEFPSDEPDQPGDAAAAADGSPAEREGEAPPVRPDPS